MNPIATYLDYLRLAYVAENYEPLAKQATEKRLPHAEYLQRLLEGEYQRRQERAMERRVHAARFPVLKTLDRFRWDWPTKINEMQIKNLFRLGFVEKKTCVTFLGPCGTGKTHLAVALGYEACQRGHSVLFTTAVDALNNLVAAHAAHRLKAELKRYLAPADPRPGRTRVSPARQDRAPTSCSRSSASATNAAPSSSRRTSPSSAGPRSSTMTPASPAPSSTASSTAPNPWSSRVSPTAPKIRLIRLPDPPTQRRPQIP